MAPRSRRAVLVFAAVVMAMALVGCAEKPAPKPQPKVTPPAVKTAGVLAVGVDMSTPPFGGVDQGKQAGIDIDVGAALANRLGLSVTYVDVKPSEAATALADGTADVVLSIPYGDTAFSQVELAGIYLSDAPAAFVTVDGTASVEPSITLDTITAPKIGAQEGSEAFWILRHEIDPDVVQAYPTLREAMQALVDGQVELLAGDFVVGNYMARDFPTVRYAGQIGPATALSAAVATDNATLSEAVRGTLDDLAADGVLGTIRRKWIGEAPEIKVEASQDATPTQ